MSDYRRRYKPDPMTHTRPRTPAMVARKSWHGKVFNEHAGQ